MRKGKRIIRALCWAHFLVDEIAFNRAVIKQTQFESWMVGLYGKRFLDSLNWTIFEESREEARSGDWTKRVRFDLHESLGLESDPVFHWEQEWDGQWRMVTFDLPHNAYKDRKELARCLRFWRFGNLQGSVWISPHQPDDFLKSLRAKNISARGLLISEGTLLVPKSDQDIVAHTWDWEQLNADYREFAKDLDQKLSQILQQTAPNKEWLIDQVQQTFELWSVTSQQDPFLPRPLWPRDYRGEKAYQKYQSFRQALRKQFPELIYE